MLKLNKVATMPAPPANKGSLWFNSTLGMWGWTDEFGTFWPVGEQRFRISADATYTTTGLLDLAGAVFPLKSGIQYGFFCFIVWQTGIVTSGLKVGLTTPATTLFSAQAIIPGIAADGTANVWGGSITTSGDSVLGSGAEAINTNYVAQIYGIIKPSADGNLQVQCANEGGANNVVVKVGTCGKLWVT